MTFPGSLLLFFFTFCFVVFHWSSLVVELESIVSYFSYRYCVGIIFSNSIRILLMCALRAHINFYFWEFFFSRIKKVMTVFSISEKMFPKVESLICALKAHINRIHSIISIHYRTGLGLFPISLMRLLSIVEE